MPRRLIIAVLLYSVAAYATIFGSVHGLIHDPQHRPMPNAHVTIRSASSDWKQSTATDDAGEFHFDNVPLGEYKVAVDTPGFALEEQKLTLTSGRDARLHFSLSLAAHQETVEVTDQASAVNPSLPPPPA